MAGDKLQQLISRLRESMQGACQEDLRLRSLILTIDWTDGADSDVVAIWADAGGAVTSASPSLVVGGTRQTLKLLQHQIQMLQELSQTELRNYELTREAVRRLEGQLNHEQASSRAREGTAGQQVAPSETNTGDGQINKIPEGR